MSSNPLPRHAAAAGGATSRRRIRRGVGAGVLLLLGLLALGGGITAGAALTGSIDSVTDKFMTLGSAAPVTTQAQEDTALEESEPQDRGPDPGEAQPATPAPIDFNLIDAEGLTLADRTAGLLSTAVPTSASGRLVVVPGNQPAPEPDRTVRTVRVEVEAGLEVNPQAFADFVMETLNDGRGWGGDGTLSFARTDGVAHIRVVLASPRKVDEMCAPLRTLGIYSCGRYGHAAINYTRWVQATAEFPDHTVYRRYVINHEVGHLLGRQHVTCPGAGQLAPIMQQQTIRVEPCLPNAWPNPAAG